MENNKSLLILGIRGIPANHGGFETFAEHLAKHLQSHNWSVTVYCQVLGRGKISTERWNDIWLINIPIPIEGALGTILFDLLSIIHSIRKQGPRLVLGYNTAIFGIILRLMNHKQIINMDGIEWKRDKWGKVARLWFYLNERIACIIGNQLVADHPEIQKHLETRVKPDKITMIPYGGDELEKPDMNIHRSLGIFRNRYFLIVARAEPENSILELVQSFVIANLAGYRLVVLGNYDKKNTYHQRVLNAANNNVVFTGAIFEKKKVSALREFCTAYLHGHKVGGTNPSLVEAMAAGCAIVAHDNKFNNWVAGPTAQYFSNVPQCVEILRQLCSENISLSHMQSGSRERFKEYFHWNKVLHNYESLLENWINK